MSVCLCRAVVSLTHILPPKRIVQQAGASKSRFTKRSIIPRKTVFAFPHFVDKDGKVFEKKIDTTLTLTWDAQVPPDNPDTVRKAKLRGNVPQVHRHINCTLSLCVDVFASLTLIRHTIRDQGRNHRSSKGHPISESKYAHEDSL